MARTNKLALGPSCTRCGESSSGTMTHIASNGGPSRILCCRCTNLEMAEGMGIPYQHHEFEPMQFKDSNGGKHTFTFETRLFGTGISLDAVEKCKSGRQGYAFQVIGDSGDDQLVLLARLIEKIRRALARRHLERGDYGWRIGERGVVRARIECDLNGSRHSMDDLIPSIIIDGREFTWAEFGRMLMTYEGWQFKLEIHDKSEEF